MFLHRQETEDEEEGEEEGEDKERLSVEKECSISIRDISLSISSKLSHLNLS
jgi:hypothetical protein